MTDRRHRVHPLILTRARELRQPQTPAEARLWARLQNRQLGGFKFRRQHPIGRFIVDFYCAACRLAIEIDGPSHTDQVEYDQARTAWLTDRGHHVIRFTNQDVFQRLDAALEAILEECDRLAQTQAPSPDVGEGGG
jgi:very-short-patch-repair endonuclease